MRIYSNNPLKEGKDLEIELFLPDGQSVAAIARVVWVKALPPGSEALYDVGLKFIKLSPDAVKALKAVLKNTLKNE